MITALDRKKLSTKDRNPTDYKLTGNQKSRTLAPRDMPDGKLIWPWFEPVQLFPTHLTRICPALPFEFHAFRYALRADLSFGSNKRVGE